MGAGVGEGDLSPIRGARGPRVGPKAGHAGHLCEYIAAETPAGRCWHAEQQRRFYGIGGARVGRHRDGRAFGGGDEPGAARAARIARSGAGGADYGAVRVEADNVHQSGDGLANGSHPGGATGSDGARRQRAQQDRIPGQARLHQGGGSHGRAKHLPALERRLALEHHRRLQGAQEQDRGQSQGEHDDQAGPDGYARPGSGRRPRGHVPVLNRSAWARMAPMASPAGARSRM